jgi:hypothetical protein
VFKVPPLTTILVVLAMTGSLDDISWMVPRLEATGLKMDEKVHGYESSWYGPLNKMTSTIFSGADFMVKPQPTIRRTVQIDSDEEFDFEGASRDSMGVPVISDKFLRPDFLIVRVPEDGSLDGDEVVACIEVKKDDEGQKSAEQQMKTYLDWISEKNPHTAVKGILILGSITYVYSITGRRMPTADGAGISTSHPKGLRKALEAIAKEVKKNWRKI